MRSMLSVRNVSSGLALLTALAAQPAAAAPNLIRTLPNKMTVIVRENRTRPLASVQVWVNAGIKNESRSERGASVVLSYLPYIETARRPRGDMQKEVSAYGGTFGGESGYSQIIYNMTVPAKHVTRAIDVLSDAVIRASVNQYTVDQAIARARSESRSALSTAAGASLNTSRLVLFGDTPLGAPGNVPELELAALTPSIIDRFYKENFVASNVLVVVDGDVEAEPTADAVEAAFKEMPAGKGRNVPRIDLKPMNGPAFRWEPAPPSADGNVITAAFRGPAWGSADAIALDVLMAALVDAPDSRFERRLRESADVPGAAAAYRSLGPDGGIVALTMSTDPTRMKEAEALLVQEVERVRAQPITPEECDAAVREILARELSLRSELWGLGRTTALAWYQGRPGADEVYAQRVRAVTSQDLSGVARKYLDWKNAAVVEMMPAKTGDSLGVKNDFDKRFKEKLALYQGTFRTGPQATASTDDARRSRLDQPLASISKEPFDPGRGRVERKELAGGIRLLTGVDRSAPGATVAVYMAGGVRYENDKNNGITSLLKECLLNTYDPKRSGHTYRQSLSLLGPMVPYQDRDMWGLSLSTPGSEWKESLNRIGAMLAHPDLDSTNVDATRIMLLNALDHWLDDDDAQRARLIFPTKYTVSGYRLPGLGNKINLVSMPLSSVNAYYRKFVVKPNIVVAVFGDVDPAEVAPAVEQAFREVRSEPFDPGVIAKDLPFPNFREKWELGAGPNTTVQLAFNGPPAASPDMPAMYVVNSLLTGPKGWFAQFMRNEPGVVGVTSIVAQAADESPIIATATIEGPPREEPVVKLLFRQFKKVGGVLLAGELAADFQNAKTHAIATFQSTLTSNTPRAFQWSRSELFGLGPEYLVTLPSKMDAVTPEDVRAVGKAYFEKSDWERHPYAIAETRPGGW
jgi:zinc protease